MEVSVKRKSTVAVYESFRDTRRLQDECSLMSWVVGSG